MQLTHWLKKYISFKDCLKKEIINIEETPDYILVKEKKGTKVYFVDEELEKIITKKTEHKAYYVCLNSKKNIKTMLGAWEHLIKNKNMTLLFAHPTTNDVWLITPATHHLIADANKFKEGIQTLHESIPTTL